MKSFNDLDLTIGNNVEKTFIKFYVRKERHQCTYTLNLAANFQDIKNVMTLKMWNVTQHLIQKVTILVMAGFDIKSQLRFSINMRGYIII